MSPAILLAALLLAVPARAERPAVKGLSREEAAARAARVSDAAYRLQFVVGFDEKEFTGVTDISFNLKGAPAPLTVDFGEGLPRKVTANGADTAFDYNGHFLTLPPSALRKGANTVRIEYSHPYSATGSGLYRFKDPADGLVYLYSDFEPFDANLMFPCFDQPDIKAGYAVEVTAPEDWLVVSAARPERVLPAGPGARRWVFPMTKPFSTYVFSLHAGPYMEWRDDFQGLPLGLYARRSLARFVDAEEWFTVTKQGMGFFNRYFDFPYPFGKYDQVLVPDFNSGAMENVGAVTFSERNAPRSRPTPAERLDRADVILHEMAHMWFGDLVTMAWWDDLWLNESFASYMSAVAVDAATEFRDAWLDFNLGTKQWAYWEDQLVTTHPIEAVVPDTEVAFANFDGITYGKGASTLKQLAVLLG
ncbi:MAG: aminopeptidase N, partial [Elusimicrobia bacterium]